jgi:hypothetical protein
MELDELAQARLIVLLVVLAMVAFWVRGVVTDRRRQARFAALAQSFGAEVVREGEFLSRFPVEIDGRMFDVRLRHIGRGSGNWAPGWCVITGVALRGVPDIHSAEIRPRMRRPRAVDPRDPDFEKHFPVLDAGYPLRQGWLNDRVRGAIAHFYALELPLDPLILEEGRLIHRSLLPVQRFDGTNLRELLTRQSAVAAALERAL